MSTDHQKYSTENQADDAIKEYPAHFPPGKLLGNFHNECVQALAGGTTILGQTDTAELRNLMDYANKFHHETNPA